MKGQLISNDVGLEMPLYVVYVYTSTNIIHQYGSVDTDWYSTFMCLQYIYAYYSIGRVRLFSVLLSVGVYYVELLLIFFFFHTFGMFIRESHRSTPSRSIDIMVVQQKHKMGLCPRRRPKKPIRSGKKKIIHGNTQSRKLMGRINAKYASHRNDITPLWMIRKTHFHIQYANMAKRATSHTIHGRQKNIAAKYR